METKQVLLLRLTACMVITLGHAWAAGRGPIEERMTNKAYDCHDERTAIIDQTPLDSLFENMTTPSWKGTCRMAGVGFSRCVIMGHVINSLLKDNVFFMRSFNHIENTVLVLHKSIIYRLLCAEVEIAPVKTEQCYEHDTVKTKKGQLKYYDVNTKMLYSHALQIPCAPKNKSLGYQIIRTFDGMGLIRTSSKAIGHALFNGETIREDFAKLFDAKSAKNLVILEENSLDHALGSFTWFIRAHGPKISLIYVTTCLLVGIGVVALACYKKVTIIKALSLVITPAKIYCDYIKLLKETE